MTGPPDAPAGAMHEIFFTEKQVALFSRASGDVNPLHVSRQYASKTSFGQPVVFGCLAALGALARISVPPAHRIAAFEASFLRPVYVGIRYALTIQSSPGSAVWLLRDGKTVLASGTVRWAPGASPKVAPLSPSFPRAEPRQWPDSAICAGLEITGEYAPDPDAFRELWTGLRESLEPDLPVAWLLLWGSFFTGMELPGLPALFHRYAFQLEESAAWEVAAPLDYSARVLSFKPRLRIVNTRVDLSSAGILLARAEMAAFVRPHQSRTTNDAITKILPPSHALRGKVALIAGGSRGLGAAIARALALQGCTVIASYKGSAGEAALLKDSLAGASGEVLLAQGDAADPAWCRQMLSEVQRLHGHLDLLVCNACPTPLSLGLEPAAIDRVNSFLQTGFQLVSVPLAFFLETLAASAGSAVVVSSTAVEEPVREWPHYVALKNALEGLVRVAAMQYEKVGFIVLRPPRLLTDMTNTPVPVAKAIAPEVVAARLVARLLQPVCKGRVEVLHGGDAGPQ